MEEDSCAQETDRVRKSHSRHRDAHNCVRLVCRRRPPLRDPLSSTGDVTGEWTGTLMRADGTSTTQKICVESTGKFMVRVMNREVFELQAGLQLQVAKDGLEGRCWVHNEWLLDVARIKNVPMGAIQRLLQGEAEEEDDVEFIDFLSSSLHEVMPTPSNMRAQSSGAAKPDETVPNRSVAVSALQPREGSAAPVDREFDIDRGDRMQRLMQRLFGHFEKSIHGQPSRRRTCRVHPLFRKMRMFPTTMRKRKSRSEGAGRSRPTSVSGRLFMTYLKPRPTRLHDALSANFG